MVLTKGLYIKLINSYNFKIDKGQIMEDLNTYNNVQISEINYR